MESLASWNDAENITYRVVPTLAQRQDGQGGRSKNPARKEWNTGEQSPRSVRTRRQPVPHPARAHSLSGQEIGLPSRGEPDNAVSVPARELNIDAVSGRCAPAWCKNANMINSGGYFVAVM